MDLTTLRQFLVVARLEHLSRAADELHVAQPSLSRTIARLESELGTQLFDRAGRLQLNDAGKLFRDYVERSLGELDAGRRALAEATGEGFGSVRLASETLLTLTGPLTVFKRAHPAVEIELHQLSAEEMARRLRSQDLDLCVVSQPLRAAGLESVQLFEEAVGVATPYGHPLAGRTSVTIEELADQPLITAGNGHWLRLLLDRLFAGKGLTPKVVCESDEASAIAALISAGVGIGLVPDLARRSATRVPAVWIAVDHPDCRRTTSLYWGAGSQLSPAARLMRSAITEWEWVSR